MIFSIRNEYQIKSPVSNQYYRAFHLNKEGAHLLAGFFVVSLFEVSRFILCFFVVSCFIAGLAIAAKDPNVNADNINAANNFFIVSKFKFD
jgi:hypothetical protein